MTGARGPFGPDGCVVHAGGQDTTKAGAHVGVQEATDPAAHLAVTEFTDPACPWAWGSEPAFRLLRHSLGPRVRWRRVFGILFDENDDPAPDPDAEARWYERFIADVAVHTRAPYARRLHRLTRSSWPASLAAKASAEQGADLAEHVLRRLRESTFVLGTPADSYAGVRDVVLGVPGLDLDRLLDGMAAASTWDAVRADRAQTRRPIAQVLELEGTGPHPGRAKELSAGRRYALPTVLFDGPGGQICVPGWQPVESYFEAARTAAAAPLPGPARMSARDALEQWRTLTGPELAVLTGASQPPAGAARLDTGNGPLWLHPDEANSYPAIAELSHQSE
ncbi:DsbA family protein [Streptomyces sp. NPDC056637]|uniref:DsbA family oxidoreductase n=1 Tax=unclassified Streptomyces TaxID=2593676 RepID=UPI0036533D23